MQTCIVKGFVDKPGTKYYYYHGILKPCNIQPQIVCFDQVDTKDEYLPPKSKTFTADLYTSYEACDWGYLVTRNRLTGSYAYTEIGQKLEEMAPGYIWCCIQRMGLAWDTIFLPYDCKIVSAKVRLDCDGFKEDEPFNLILSNGMPDYPNLTYDGEDYQLSKYSGIGGKVAAGPVGWVEIPLNDIGLTWINVDGYTKFMLLDENDYLGIPPTFEEYILFSWTANIAQLVVVYQEKNHKFTITFDKNDVLATGIMRGQEILENLKEHLNKNSFHKNGWTFTGWAETGGGAVAYIDEAFYTIGSANVTIYAKWTANLYTITFDKNNVLATGTMADQDIYCGSIADLRVNEFLLNGWYFDGWAEKTDGVVRYYDEWPYTMGVGNLSLYAKYKPYLYKITFDKNDVGATGTMADLSIYCGSSANLRANTFDKIGWSFIGWAEAPAGPVVYVDQEYIEMGPADITIYAIWVANTYKITFDKNDILANGQMDDQGILSGSSANLDKVNFSKYLWTFMGWAETSDGPVVYVDQGSYTMGVENVTLYAKWLEHVHKITFKKNSVWATGTMADQKIGEGLTAQLSECNFARPGWTFAGWAVTSEGPVIYLDQGEYTMGTENVIIYAIWVE